MKQTNKVLLVILAVAMILSFGFSKSFSQVTDKDGNTYKTVTIGTQEWTAENLNVEHYRNGDLIPQVQDSTEWSKLTTGAWCYYDNKTSNGKIFGKLYNFYAVTDKRGLAPEGWHISTKNEWEVLENILEGYELSATRLKSTSGWYQNYNGTNETGFTALPGGFRDDIGEYDYIYISGYFWSPPYGYLFSNPEYKAIGIGDSNNHISSEGDYRFHGGRSSFSVRCVRD
jgi:uncharacterized protein (TIGR02145 family)